MPLPAFDVALFRFGTNSDAGAAVLIIQVEFKLKPPIIRNVRDAPMTWAESDATGPKLAGLFQS
jgi:hypothetical protein